MTAGLAAASLLWPALLVIGLFALYLSVVERAREPRQAIVGGIIGCFALLAFLYQAPPAREAVRWGLTVVGFALPPALGVISIVYVVRETK